MFKVNRPILFLRIFGGGLSGFPGLDASLLHQLFPALVNESARVVNETKYSSPE